MRTFLTFTLFVTLTASAQTLPEGYWPESKSSEILAKTETIRLDPDLSSLTPEERAALQDLIDVGKIFQKLYESSRHAEALPAYDKLRVLDVQTKQSKATQNLLDLYRLNQGPIATTLDNKREPFLPVSPQTPARNVYPLDATRDEIEKFVAAHPELRDAILGERTIVRRATTNNIGRDQQMLNTFALLRELHPDIFTTIRAMRQTNDPSTLYAVPYSVAYADELVQAFRLLQSAATKIEKSDPEFARYLRNRGRDLVTNDYESGDASWVTGRFKRLNAQIGAYETYDDPMFGAKAFHAVSILLLNEKVTNELRAALGGLQAIEDALPCPSTPTEAPKRVREDIPVGVYQVIADFGQARGTNTATILPNDALFARRYGRTILMRENIMKHPSIVAADQRVWRAATVDAHANDLATDGNFLRTLWHEIGHYLGPNGEALEDYADATEEMKADLVSLFALHRMNHPSLRAIQAAGVRRTLQNVKPRRDQPYQTMQLIQFNWFLDKGLISLDGPKLKINYDRYPETVTSLLREVLKLQHDGNKAAAVAFFDKWTTWGDAHEKLAARIREAQGARFRIVRYAALGE